MNIESWWMSQLLFYGQLYHANLRKNNIKTCLWFHGPFMPAPIAEIMFFLQFICLKNLPKMVSWALRVYWSNSKMCAQNKINIRCFFFLQIPGCNPSYWSSIGNFPGKTICNLACSKRTSWLSIWDRP